MTSARGIIPRRGFATKTRARNYVCKPRQESSGSRVSILLLSVTSLPLTESPANAPFPKNFFAATSTTQNPEINVNIP